LKNYLNILLILFFSVLARGQDFHFSQFNENPSLLNPALTGANGMRASINNKSQWRSITTPYRTFGASFEMRNTTIKQKAAGNLENTPATEKVPGKFAAGFSIYKDRAGDGRMILTQANLNLATFLNITDKSALSFGVQAGYASRRIDNPNFVFPNQYGPTGYDPDIISGEEISGDKFRYLDLGAGLLWSFSDEERGIKNHIEKKAHIGFSAYHLTTPKQKYLSKTSDKIPMRLVAHGDVLFSIPNTRTALVPAYLVQFQGTHLEILAGAMFRYYMKNDTRYTGYVKRNTFGGGLYYRGKDAIIVSGLVEWQEQYAIGLSYDINASGLSKISRVRGGLELTLRYNAANSFIYQKVK
jgi:type IX secretion system PorP/SprF family membrane protein